MSRAFQKRKPRRKKNTFLRRENTAPQIRALSGSGSLDRILIGSVKKIITVDLLIEGKLCVIGGYFGVACHPVY